MKDYAVCVQNKIDNLPYVELLQPLPIPTQAWQEITMDFIEALPKSEGKDTILVVIDRLTKYANFVSLAHPFTAPQVARAFLDTVYRLHGLPRTILTDRDKVFTSQVWQELFKMIGIKLCNDPAH